MDDGADTAAECALREAMRRLWEDHITWTRLFIVSALADLPDAGPTAERLLRNQSDIGNAIKPFFGDEAGEALTALLRDHIVLAADLVAALKAGDETGITGAQTRWYDNADAIAAFLSSANPESWPRDEMGAMMRAHLDNTAAEVLARMHRDWTADIAAYDKVHAQILLMADMLSAGIIRRFPEHFA